MSRIKLETLDFEQTLMYGQYKEDLARFARSLSTRSKRRRRNRFTENQISKFPFLLSISKYVQKFWKSTFGRISNDWPFLALLGITMAIISFTVDFFIIQCHRTRMLLYDQLLAQNIVTRYIGWISLPILLLMFAAGIVSIISPQAIGSGIPEMKTILRGVILHEYLSFRTLIAKLIGLACSLGSGLPLGKEGPFVHVGSMMATLLSKLFGSFEGVYDKGSRTTEMLAAACAVGVATTFYAPIGGVLFSVEVTTDFFAVRDYWRGFFAACCAATVWRLFTVWFRHDTALTSLFKTSFRTDFPFDPQELLVFAFIGVACGLGAAAYVRCHRQVVHFIRTHKKLNSFLKKNRFIYPGLITLILMTVSFPPFIGQYMVSTLSNGQIFRELFSNISWVKASNDTRYLTMVQHWSTSHTSIYVNLIICIINTFWMSILASTIPVPSGLFVPMFKIGAMFGRLVGEIMATCFPDGIPFSGYRIPIVPGGYSVVGAAAFTGAVTHTISITVIVFEMTGQMTHMIPVILSVLISNAICQKLELSIYDSVIQIKKLPFLSPLMGSHSLAHEIFVDDIMIRDVVCVWRNDCTYKNIQHLLANYPNIRTFPLVDNSQNMILLGSIQREELQRIIDSRLSRQRRLQAFISEDEYEDIKTDNKTQPTINWPFYENKSPENKINKPKPRFEVSLVEPDSSTTSNRHTMEENTTDDTMSYPKSILKQSFRITYSPNSTINNNLSTITKDARLRLIFEDIFHKSLKLEDANPQSKQPVSSDLIQRRVKLPRKRVIDLELEEQKRWEEAQLNMTVEFEQCSIDPAPFQLVERTTIYKVHLLFSMLALSQAYVTSAGRLVGVVALKDLRIGIEKINQGLLLRPSLSKNDQLLDSVGSQSEDDANSISKQSIV